MTECRCPDCRACRDTDSDESDSDDTDSDACDADESDYDDARPPPCHERYRNEPAYQMRVYRDGKHSEEEYCGFICTRCRSDSGHSELVQSKYPDGSVIIEVDFSGQRLQLICQHSPLEADADDDDPGAQRVINDDVAADPSLMLRATAQACQCGADAGCGMCVRPPTAPTAVHDGFFHRPPTYSLAWVPGAPHSMFDLDVVCVAVRSTGAGLEFDRRCGEPRSRTVRVRPQGVWRLGPDPVESTAAALDNTFARIDKYAARGWTDVQVSDKVTLDRQTVATPQTVLDRVRRVRSALL